MLIMLRIVSCAYVLFFFFFNDTATTEIYTLSLHDALPIRHGVSRVVVESDDEELVLRMARAREPQRGRDHLAELRAHAAARVDDEPDSDRSVFIGEKLDWHTPAVVEHREAIAIEIRNQLS